MKYAAPTLALVNVTSGCYKELTKSDIQRDNTVRASCLRNGGSRGQRWEVITCGDFNITKNVDIFKVVNKDGYNHIYCYPHKIKTNTWEADCPTHPFKLPDEESFTTETHIYISERKMIVTGKWDAEIAASKINYKLKTHTVPIIIEEPELELNISSSQLEPIRWIRSIPSSIPDMDWVREQVGGGVGRLISLNYLPYLITGVMILFIISFTMPLISLWIWILGRSVWPIKMIWIWIRRINPPRKSYQQSILPEYIGTRPTYTAQAKKKRIY